MGRNLSRFTLRLQHTVKQGRGLYRPGSMENFKQIDPFIFSYHPNPRISASDPVYTNPDNYLNRLHFYMDWAFRPHEFSGNRCSEWLNTWSTQIRVNKCTVLKMFGFVQTRL